MIARLIIAPIKVRAGEIQKILASRIGSGNTNHPDVLTLHIPCVKLKHPDVLYFAAGEKLGIAEARKIKEHFSLKPYSAKGRMVVIEDASVMTHEAQNALLKTLEEPPQEAILILGAPSDANFLPTILSRCQIIHLQNPTSQSTPTSEVGYSKDLEKLLVSSIKERFEYAANLKERAEFLHGMTYFFREELLKNPNPETKDFLKQLLQAEEWAKQNVNIRAILEYLMLKMPKNARYP